MSKIVETVLAPEIKSGTLFDDYQFGFKYGHSTGMCTSVFKNTVKHYTQQGSHVFVCFVDLSKAFDRVNYWKLFVTLLRDKVNVDIVRLLSYWYIHQEVCVQWHNTVSAPFNSTHQLP